MRPLQITMLFVSILFFIISAKAQTINWASLQPQQKHMVNINVGFEHGVIIGSGYGYQLNTKMPIILTAEYSFPSGNNLLDDFKTKMGGQIRLAKMGDFQVSTKIYGLFRKYENSLVRMVNFGSEISGIMGYYKPKWFVAAEFGFDKAIATNFKHSNTYKEIYPLVQDGWYEPATGGNFKYGLQVGYSFKRNDLYLKAGQVITQDFKTKPFIPFYLQLGYNLKINGRRK
jgi:hypothetical protein